MIDAEIVGCDANGIPDFRSLMAGNAHGFCAWCFDLLSVGGKDVRRKPLEERRARLEGLLAGADADLLRFSEAFDDAEKLLAAALELGLEGIVSKKRDQPYRSGKNVGWVNGGVARREPGWVGAVSLIALSAGTRRSWRA